MENNDTLKQRNIDSVLGLCKKCRENDSGNGCLIKNYNTFCENCSEVLELADKAYKYDTLDLTIEEIKEEERNAIINVIKNSNLSENDKNSLIERLSTNRR